MIVLIVEPYEKNTLTYQVKGTVKSTLKVQYVQCFPAIAEGMLDTCYIIEPCYCVGMLRSKSVYVATNLYKKNARCCGRSFDLITRVASVDKVAVSGGTACCTS